MSRRTPDFRYPVSPPWTWVDTVLVGIVAIVAVAAFAGLVLLWFMMYPTGIKVG